MFQDHVAGSEKELRTMVHEVNHTQVEPEEILFGERLSLRQEEAQSFYLLK
ncbi:MAG: hypothetical protein ACLR6B_08350 [Blautia sp.]